MQTFALVSILAPNSLEVSSASPRNTNISVPTALFNKPVNKPGLVFECLWILSEDLQKVLGLALHSDTLVGWNAPAECGTACNYTIQYSAPALRCTELAIDEVHTMLPVSQETGDGTVYNATKPVGELVLEPLSIAWRTYDTNGKSTVAGTRCLLYNTTQQSVVSFVNNTGTIFSSIISYNNPVNIVIIDCPKPVEGTSVSLYTYIMVGQ